MRLEFSGSMKSVAGRLFDDAALKEGQADIRKGHAIRARGTAIDNIIQRSKRKKVEQSEAGQSARERRFNKQSDEFAKQASTMRGAKFLTFSGGIVSGLSGFIALSGASFLASAAAGLAEKGFEKRSQNTKTKALALKNSARMMQIKDAARRGGKAYLNDAAKAKAQAAPQPAAPGGAAQPGAVGPDGMTAGYIRIDPRTGKTVQVKGYRTPGR